MLLLSSKHSIEYPNTPCGNEIISSIESEIESNQNVVNEIEMNFLFKFSMIKESWMPIKSRNKQLTASPSVKKSKFHL